MKELIYRLLALVLAFVMISAVLVGCKKTNDPVDNGDGDHSENEGDAGDTDDKDDTGNEDNTGDDKTDDSTDTESAQIKTTIYEISKHGNLILSMYGSALFDKGFEHGDVLEIAIGEKKWGVPLCTSYSDVDGGEAVLRAISPTDGVVLAINMGDFATTAGIAEKLLIDEEPGYRWNYLMESSVEITISVKEEGGYRDEWLIRQLVRTNDRADYPHLDDEAFANFRVITTTGIGAGVLYRSASPINPELGRSTYADKAAMDAGIITIINLADQSNTYDVVDGSYYGTCNVAYVNLGMDFLSEANLVGMANGMRYIIDNNGPYLIHCNEGKDRAGFVSALLECLMGATLDEVIDDYMITYYNYYGVEEGSEKYDAVVNNNLIKGLATVFKVDDVYKADLAKEAESYLMEDVGLTADEVTALKGKLMISLEEVYNAGKDFAALLGEHESVYVQVESDGKTLWEEYLDKQCCYTYYSKDYMSIGFEYSSYSADGLDLYSVDGAYAMGVTLSQSGVVNVSGVLELVGMTPFIADAMMNDDYTVIEKDGFIIVSCTADLDEIYAEEDVVSCVETYTIDKATREMVSVKTVYTFEDGRAEEGVVTISRDVEIPEGMKPFLEYLENTEDMRSITIVSNPGTENEKTETVMVPSGLQVDVTYDWEIEEPLTLYTDAACTQLFEMDTDLSSDLTLYAKWGEPEVDPREEMYVEAFALLEARDYEAAYLLFTALGDYKDAAKQAEYFRYVPTCHYIEYTSSDEDGSITYTVTLDDRNLPIVVVEEYSSGFKHVCTFERNELGKVTRRECTDTDGFTSLYEATYNEDGKYLTESFSDSEGYTAGFEFIYDELGKCVQLLAETNDPAYYDSYTVEYDEEGREVKVVYVYGEDIYIEETTYTEDGKLLKKTWTTSEGVVDSAYEYSYDEKGRLFEIIFKSYDEYFGVRRTTYDDNDNLITEYVSYAYGYEYTNVYEYDEQGNIVKTTYNSSDGYNDVTESEYELVYLPFDYTEDEWVELRDSTLCWDVTHR